jgi:hypothetical protein
MDAEEREVYYFLKARRHEFLSAREICRRAGGKRRFQYQPDWAKPALTRMVERGILETDPAGHYRLCPPKEIEKMKRWMSPQIAAILKKKKKEFGEFEMSVYEIDDYYDNL